MSGRSSVPAIMTLETIAPLSTRRELASVGGLTDSALPEVTRHAVTVVISRRGSNSNRFSMIKTLCALLDRE